jgi:site-specific DNA recombinase
VLGVVRLSRDREESTSPERQKAAVERWARDRGHEVIGWAEDLDVSGAVAPWKRKGLGQWVPETIGKDASKAEEQAALARSRAGEWDILCAWKLDRISRRLVHTWQLHEWCRDNGKTLATASDGVDLTTPMGEMFFMLLAMFAHSELETIKFRAKDSFDHLMKVGRWRGGFVPYGYRPERSLDGEGYRLVPDKGGVTDTAGVVHEIASRIIGGESINSVCAWLNEAGVPSSLDAQRIRESKQPKGALWRVGNLSRMLKSHTLLGWAEVTGPDGEPRLVRGEDHMPVQRAEPILNRETFDKLQTAIAERAAPKNAAANRRDRSMLVRVAMCACGQPLYLTRGRNHMYYRCGTKNVSGTRCTLDNKGIRQDALEEQVVHAFLATVGDVEVVERVYRPGIDYGAEIADVERALDDLDADRAAGLFKSPVAVERYRRQYKALTARLEELADMPTTPSGWDEVPTGETYRQRWARLGSKAERNRELRNAGVVALLRPQPVGPVGLADMLPTGDNDYFTHVARGSRVEVRLPVTLKARVREAAHKPL